MYYGSHDTSLKVKMQMAWSDYSKNLIWTDIVTRKMQNQYNFLIELDKIEKADMLENYIKDIEFADCTNREGQCAKVYFTALFGENFIRDTDTVINAALNYGYNIILSNFNRCISAGGYMTQIGIFHDNRYNMFNLGSDLMEPFRIIVDKCVYNNEFTEFGKYEKIELVKLLNKEVYICGKKCVLNNAIEIYCNSVFTALEKEDNSFIKHIEYEL